MDSLSFDPMVRLYDESRVVDPVQLDKALDYLKQRFPPVQYPRLLEPGIGTGRIAIPLARRGYVVQGVDISGSMLMLLRQRLRGEAPSLEVSFQKGDVTCLPFASGAFDLAVVVHLFYFIRQWRNAADEIARVVKREGPIVLMHTGFGAEVPFLNARYGELCRQNGFAAESVGVAGTSEVTDYFGSRGYETEWIKGEWEWTYWQPLAKALGYLEQRAFSFAVKTPEEIHQRVIRQLEEEAVARFGTRESVIAVPNEIRMALMTRS